MPRQPRQLFLLSPANTSGERAQMMIRESAQFPTAVRLRQGGVPIGELYSFISGLYFRGKLAYANTFANPPHGVSGSLVITPGRGLLPVETPITAEELRSISKVRVDLRDTQYKTALIRDAESLAEASGKTCRIILLGSVATGKYIEPLLKIFGKRLLFPLEFVGRGDMSRGGLMLRCANSGVQLTYVPVHGAVLHGERPPKLPPLPRK